MQLINIEKIHSGKFIHFYIASYLLPSGNIKKYEFVSRRKDLTINDFENPKKICAVGMIMFNEEKTKILLQKEFRLACNDWVFNFPGGLIDEGENAYIAAKRELKEETGLDLINIEDELPPAYSAVGISDELVKTIIGVASGNFSPSHSEIEEIEANWYTKEEVKKLIKTSNMSLRTQSFLYMWAYL